MMVRRLILFVALAAALQVAAQQSPNLADGFSADKLYQFGDLDAVNLFNGNLIINIPLGPNYQVSDGLSYRFNLVYNGNVWDSIERCYEQFPATGGPVSETICKANSFPSRFSNAGTGFLVTLGELLDARTEFNQSEWPVYVSPDGARTGVGPYGSSGSAFIRMRSMGANVAEIDFPDGRTQRFERTSNASPWQLKEIRDRHSTSTTNYVHVNYTTWSEGSEGGNEIELVDSYGRTQSIKFIPGFVDPNLPSGFPGGILSENGGSTASSFQYPITVRDTVRYIDLTGPGTASERYTFDYAIADGLRFHFNDTPWMPETAQFRVLRSVTLPDGSKFSFSKADGSSAYDTGGKLTTFLLPTGGRINYEYAYRQFDPFPPQYRSGQAAYTIPPDISATVSTREFVDTAAQCVPGSTCPVWRYHDDYDGSYTCILDPNGFVECPALEMKITVTDPLENRTENFFSIARSSSYPRFVNGVQQASPYSEGWRDGQYGLPITRFHTTADGKRLLSTRAYNAAGTLVRSTYIQYDSDDRDNINDIGFDNQAKDLEWLHPRVIATRTVFEDDRSCGGEACYVDVESDFDSYDGFGHYRRQKTTSNFGPTRDTFTNFNGLPSPTNRLGQRGGAFAFPPDADHPWIINTYDQQSVTEGGRTASQYFCFDSMTGRLLRTRTAGGSTAANDLVSALEYDSRGNLERESFYGGDGTAAAPANLCGFDPEDETPQYAIRHKSPNGIRTESYYIVPGSSDTKLLSLYNVTLNAVGMAVTSKDAAGLETQIEYSAMSRLHVMRPTNAAWTEYTYKNAGDPGYPFAAVLVRQHGVSFFNDDILSESQTEFDGFGRVFRETMTMPLGLKSTRRTTYNKNGWKDTVTELGSDTHFTKFDDYDPFGRPGKIIAPDGKQTTIRYAPPAGATGIAATIPGLTVQRTVEVAMPGGDKLVTTTEKHDAYERLIAVEEPSGTQSDPANPATANVTTNYTYDLWNHLTTVETTDRTVPPPYPHQSRTFTYDSRGFLEKEETPEKDEPTHYRGYDARGHLLRKQEGSSSTYDLTYSYDQAERLKQVLSSATSEPVKEFFFDDVNDGVKLLTGKGRLLKSVRHNRGTPLGSDVTVTDYYEYDNAGRVSSKETRLSTGPVFNQGFLYTDLGQPRVLQYPTCSGCGSANGPARSISLGYDYGLLTGVSGFAGITYWPNGMVHNVTHYGRTELQNTVDVQEADPNGMARPKSIDFTGYCVGPAIGTPSPATRTVAAGNPVEFSIAEVTGATYQWYKGARSVTTAPVAGQTTRTLHIDHLNESATYWVRVTANGCSSDSETVSANIQICDASVLNITQQPVSTSTPAGGSATLTVTVSGSAPAYQWYEGLSGDTSKPVPQATGTTLNLSSITVRKNYWVRISNASGCSVDSATALVDICAPPVITEQPVSQSVLAAAGDLSKELTAKVKASGTNLTYDWYNATIDPNGHVTLGTRITDQTGPEFRRTITRASTEAAWPAGKSYAVVVTDIGVVDGCKGPTTSNGFSFSVYGANECIKLISPPWDQVISPGSPNVVLSVQAEGTGLQYTWYHGINGAAAEVPNAPHAADITTNLFGGYDAYWCVITSTSCPGVAVTTPKAYVRSWTVCPLPPVSIVPARFDAAIASGVTPTFTAYVDWPHLSYQWYIGQTGDTSVPVPNGTQATVSPGQVVTTMYWVRVTNECGPAYEDSQTVLFSVGGCEGVYVSAHPQSTISAAGAGVTLRAAATSASPNLYYDWYRLDANGEPVLLNLHNATAVVAPTETTTYYAQISNNCFSAKTRQATVQIKSCSAINIAQQPQNAVIQASAPQSVTLSVAATPAGGGTLTYKWYKGESGDTSSPVPGGTTSSIVESPTQTTKYWVRITNGSTCAVDSDTAVVKWCVAPYFSPPPFGGSIRSGQSWTLHSTAQGTDLTYEWHRDSESGPLLSTDADFVVTPSVTTTYVLKVTSGCVPSGTLPLVSGPIVVDVCTVPNITAQPQNKLVFPGKAATLSVTATGIAPITYQWFDELGTQVGTNSPSLTTPPITTEPKRYFAHLQSGICGVDTAEATVSFCSLPEVVSAGGTYYVAAGQLVILHLAINPGANTFEWYRGPVGDIPGSTAVGYQGIDYAFNASTSTTYWATVTNEDGCVSHTAAYTVNLCAPTITQQPANVTVTAGGSVNLSVIASPATSYRWYIGQKGDVSAPVPNGTTATISVSPSADTRYWVRIGGSCGVDGRGEPLGFTDSESALVTVCQAPAITNTMAGGSIVRGSTINLGIVATGSNLTYQWYTGSAGDTTSPISGATSANYTASPQNTTSYWVKVTGSCGSVNSNTMTVSVCMQPSITAQPQSVSIFSGATTALSVTATQGTTSPMTYQWFRGASGDESFPVGTNSSTFTTPALTAQTDYWVKISCGICTPASSQTATVSICPFPQTIAPPADVQAAIGQITRLTATGGGENYRWYTGASGNTSTPYSNFQPISYIDVAPSVTTQYWYQVQNGSCISSSGTVTINVCVPTITTQPASIMINPGQSTTLTVAANTAGLTYQWYTGTSGNMAAPIQGATGSNVSVSPSSTTNYWVRVTGSCNRTVDSATATVTLCQPPSITQTTPGPWIARGSSFTLGVVATGTNLTYQWYTGTSGNTSSPISGATGANYTASPQNTTSYWVRVSGTCGSVNSITMTISVCMTSSITTQPQSVSIFSGSTATLSVTATQGTTSSMSYQWYRGVSGDTSVPVGTNSSSFTTPALTSDTNYWVRISCGTCNPADSQTATVSICANPQTVPTSGDVQTSVGQTTRLTAYGAGSGNTYAWYIGPAGNTSNLYVTWTQNFIDVSPTATTQYWARVTNGSCVSQTNTITVNVCVPQMTQQPQSVTIAPGASTTLTAAANTAGVTYQWYTGNSGNTASPISGATSASRTVTPSSTTNYWVRATSSCGRTVDSATATVTICSAPAITTQPPSNTNSYAGYNVNVSVQATGSNLTYQWYKGESGDMSTPVDGRDATGITTATMSYYLQTSVRVWVRVTGQCGAVNSNAVWLSVIPTITGQPQSKAVSYGSATSVTVSASAGGSQLHYQWFNYYTGAVVPGSGDSWRLALSSVTSPITVYCRVTSGGATIQSYPAELTTCSGPSVTLTVVPSGSCRMIYSNISGDYSAVEWYLGAQSDTSYWVGSQTSLYVCPSTPTTYWMRVYGPDGTCNADSVAVTVP